MKAMRNKVRHQVWNELRYQVRNRIGNQVWDEIDNKDLYTE